MPSIETLDSSADALKKLGVVKDSLKGIESSFDSNEKFLRGEVQQESTVPVTESLQSFRKDVAELNNALRSLLKIKDSDGVKGAKGDVAMQLKVSVLNFDILFNSILIVFYNSHLTLSLHG